MGTRLGYVKHFKDLEVYRRQRMLAICDYISDPDCGRLLGLCEEIGRMLGSIMQKAKSFSSHDYSLREESPHLSITDH